VLFGFGSWYLLKLLRQGPVPAPPRESQRHQTPARPMSAADERQETR
jgi:cytochrome d ubiquinol oxidase subunit I